MGNRFAFKMAAPLLVNLIVFLFSLINCLSSEIKWTDSFREELFIKPLPSGHVYSYFQFTTVWNTSSQLNPYQHCHLFPRGLGEIITRHNVQELHISLTAGLWRHEKWGYPVFDAPPGAEVWVWFKNGTTDVGNTWKKLTSSLSGLLCASLNFIDDTNSINPQYSFRHAGVISQPADPTLLRYGTLPQEIVCTENLTPWKKLLPCDSKRGLATLLNAGYIHSTNYHSLGIHVRDICRDKTCTETSIELTQTVSLIYDLIILDGVSKDFSLRKLFGAGLPNRCPLADESKIYVDVTAPYELNPEPSYRTLSRRGGSQRQIAVYDLKKFSGMFNIAAIVKKPSQGYSQKNPPLLWASRYISGYGRQKGGIVTKLFNKHWQPLNVVVLEIIPWFVPVYLHTLKVVANGVDIKPAVVKYIPGKQRVSASHLEFLVQLPPRSVTEISIDFDYMSLKWQEYPPDASHGFYIGSSIITSLLPLAKNYTGIPQDESFFESSFNASRDGYLVQLRTEAMLITLPTPDFSMPYNVICLACTVVALAFGPIHNITTKRLRLSKTKKPQGILSQLIWKAWNSIKAKKDADKKKPSTTYKTMFSDPKPRLRMKAPACKHPTSGVVIKATPKSIQDLKKMMEVQGSQGKLFYRQPSRKQVSSYATVVVDLDDASKKVSFGSESDAEVRPAMVITLPAKGGKMATKGTQTDYRESEAQTLPWKHEVKAEGQIFAELTALEWFSLERNFPPGMEEARLIEKSREKLAWENIVARLRGKENEERRRTLVSRMAAAETAFREGKLEEAHRERIALSRERMREAREKFEEKLAVRLQRSYGAKRRENDEKIDYWKHQMNRKLRKIKSARNPPPPKGDIIAAHLDKTSEIYAPLLRDGENPARGHEVIRIQCRYLKRFHGLQALEKYIADILKPQFFRADYGFVPKSKTPRLCPRKFKEKVIEEPEERRFDGLMFKVRVPVPPPTPEPDPIPRVTRSRTDSEEDLYQASLLLEKIIKGRAIQCQKFLRFFKMSSE